MIPLLLLVLPLLSPPNYVSAQSPTSPSDRTVLLLLRSSLGVRSRDWPRRSDPCSFWLGLTCTNTTSARRVVALDLSPLRRTHRARSNPRFAIDPVRNLTRLASLNSTGFPLPGPIPAWLGSTSLSSLVLRSSSITGPIPPELALLRSLETLILADNSLSGPIPEKILALQLDSLDVSSNNLTGTLPESLPTNASHNATAASVFNLSKNAFFGPVPAYFRRFRVVDLSDNYFQGNVNASAAGLGLNCLRNVPDQRSLADCEEFYRGKGLDYDPQQQESPVREEKSRTWKYILAGALGAVSLAVAVVVLFVLCSKRARARTADRGSAPVGIGAVSSRMAPPPSRAVSKNSPAIGEAFTYEQLVRATSSFSGTNLIKKGHSGDLYHGVLEGGFSVVVKRIDLTATKGEGYVAELDLFARALHTRMVPFLGQCSENENESQIFLVYKNMVHGDLSGALYKKPKQGEEGLMSLDWITRLKIAIGVAEALCVLHHECNPPLVHRDVQASSILLDNKFEVHLGSLSEVCAQEGDEHQNVFTRFLRRSKKPEESASGLLPATCSYDVYCLGKVLLELVTGKLGISDPNSSASTNEWLDHTLTSISIYEKESVAKIIDPSLILDEDLLEEAWAVAIMAKSCLNPNPSKRPLARHVLKALENPLKVVRVDSRMNTARLMTTSSRGSWHGALFGSWRHSSSDIVPTSGPLREDRSLRRSSTRRSHESLGDPSSSNKRASRDIFPEPLGEEGDIEGLG